MTAFAFSASSHDDGATAAERIESGSVSAGTFPAVLPGRSDRDELASHDRNGHRLGRHALLS